MCGTTYQHPKQLCGTRVYVTHQLWLRFHCEHISPWLQTHIGVGPHQVPLSIEPLACGPDNVLSPRDTPVQIPTAIATP